jgi:tetraacyldisaccharide 4'-kinase
MKPHPVLYPLSLLYGVGVWLRNLLFDIGVIPVRKIGVPVISIGNITAGGSGKTPLTIATAKFFLEKGKNVAIITRGYRRTSRGTLVVSDGKKLFANSSLAGDEAVLMAQQAPQAIIIADELRVRGARKAVDDFHADIIVLDDGFQHRYVQRDLDIVLIDGSRPFFDTGLLPAGYRREPLSSLKRAGAVMVTKVEQASAASDLLNDERLSFVPDKFSSSFVPVAVRNVFSNVRQSLEMVKKHSVVAFSGIADPKHFESDILKLGAQIHEYIIFNDHHQYRKADIRYIAEMFRAKNADMIVTTEKDAVKMSEFYEELSRLPVFALVMEVRIHQQQWRRLLSHVIE